MPYSIVIPSRSTDNAIACVRRILQMQPTMDASKIIVVDDGISASDFIYGIGRVPVRIVPGEKPFIFARNVNIGIKAAGDDDVIILGDDGLLQTEYGFDKLSKAANEYPELGIVSAVTNSVGNPNQMPCDIGMRTDPVMVCYICVYIRREALNKFGPMDERYCIDYGCCDADHCYAARQAGFKIGIYDFCEIDHTSLPSEFRKDGPRSFMQNLGLFEQKWGVPYGT